MKDHVRSACVVLVDLEQDRLSAIGIVALAEERQRTAGVTKQSPSMLVHRLPTQIAGIHDERYG